MYYVYCSHWSDRLQKWDKPIKVTKGNASLGLPFGYFLANNDIEAQEFVDNLPPLKGVFEQGYFPNTFYLANLVINYDIGE